MKPTVILRRNSGASGWWTIALLAVVGLVIVIVANVYSGQSTSRELQAKLDEIQAIGAPITLEELAASYYQDEEGTRAGRELAAVFSRYVAPSDIDDPNLLFMGHSPDLDEVIPPAVWRASERHLDINAGYLMGLTRTLERYDRFYFPIEFSQGIEAELPHLASLRTATRMLCMRAMIYAKDGNFVDSVTDLELACKVAGSIREEPLLISQLVAIACVGVSTNALEKILFRYSFTDSQLRRLQAAYSENSLAGHMQQILIGERAFIVDSPKTENLLDWFKEQWSAYDPSDTSRIPTDDEYWDLELLHMLEEYEHVIQLGDAPSPEWRRLGEAREDVIAERPNHGYRASKLQVPALYRVYDAENRAVATERLATLAIAVRRYALERNRLPVTLRVLAPEYLEEIPIDPYSGEPIRIRREGGGIAIYCLGDDRDDDGALDLNNKGLRDDGDIVFHINRPESKR